MNMGPADVLRYCIVAEYAERNESQPPLPWVGHIDIVSGHTTESTRERDDR